MAYVLRHDNEFDRLEEQSHLPNYDFKKELRGFNLQPGEVFLDACCGSAIVARHMAKTHPASEVLGVDIGVENLKKAAQFSMNEGLKNINFHKEDITKLSFGDNSFDKIVCRYAIQHVKASQRQKAISELYRVLKPSGQLWIIDFDGTLYNLFPQTKFLSDSFNKMQEQNIIDLRIGRKLPFMVSNESFKEVSFDIECMNFHRNGLSEEVAQLEARFINARDFLIDSLGDELSYKRFVKEFFECLKTPGASYFYNKFIIKATK